MDKRKSILQKVKDIGTYLMQDTTIETVEEVIVEPEVKLATETLDNGTVIEAEAFEPEQAVFIVNEDERVPLPVGEYVLANGQVLTVSEEGMIASIGDAVEEAEPEVEAEVETVTMEMFNELKEKVEQMLSKEVEASDEADLELSKEKEKVIELQKVIDETPDAKTIKIPKVELKQVRPSTVKGRILQSIKNIK